MQSNLTLDDIKNTDWQQKIVFREVSRYIREDLGDCGWSETDNWLIHDPAAWQDIFDLILFGQMVWQNQDPDPGEEAAYNRVIKSLGRVAAKELKKRLALNRLRKMTAASSLSLGTS
jgi:hypothetical protein